MAGQPGPHLGHGPGQQDRVAGDEPGLGAKGLGRPLGDALGFLSVHRGHYDEQPRTTSTRRKQDEALVGASSCRGIPFGARSALDALGGLGALLLDLLVDRGGHLDRLVEEVALRLEQLEGEVVGGVDQLGGEG